MKYKNLSNCLACESTNLLDVLNLGQQPLANSYRKTSEQGDEESFPLLLRVCLECWHGQLSIAVDPGILYENYFYVSGTTSTLKANFQEFARRIAKINPRSSVLDIAANDGSFVNALLEEGLSACGIDPAKNLVDQAINEGLPIHLGFWSAKFAKDFNQKFDVITAMNVLAHVSDPADFLLGCGMALNDGGSIFIQTSQAFMVNRGEFDTIYHEHHSFFTTYSLQKLAERVNLYVVDGQYVDIHGTSYRWELKATKGSGATALLQDEARRGMAELETFIEFASIAKRRAIDTASIVQSQRASGYTICAYGAAAKAQTFFNFAGISPDLIVDDNPLKQGLRSPGSGVVIQNPDVLRAIPGPIQFVISAWNFVDEIKRNIAEIRSGRTDDQFLTYFPEIVND
jgi:SAM-dependent methyltransferase